MVCSNLAYELNSFSCFSCYKKRYQGRRKFAKKISEHPNSINLRYCATLRNSPILNPSRILIGRGNTPPNMEFLMSTSDLHVFQKTREVVFLDEMSMALIGFISGVLLVLLINGSLLEKHSNSPPKFRSFMETLKSHDSEDLRSFVGSVPSSLNLNNIERAEWFNKIIAAAWPYLDEATSNVITSALDPILQTTRPTFLTSLRFESFSFGSVPATIEGVKVYDTQDQGAIEIDVEIFWAGDPDVVLGIRAAQDTLNVPVSLTELQCAFTLRLIFAPLIGVFPCFGALTIALVDEPSLDFDLRVVGGDITLVPGIAQPLRTYIKALISSYLIWPRFITFPIPGTGYAVPSTCRSDDGGSLEVLFKPTINENNCGDEIGCQVACTANRNEISKEIRFIVRGIEAKKQIPVRIPVQDSLKQTLIMNWYCQNTLPSPVSIAKASIPLHELFASVSRDFSQISSKIVLGTFAIEFENSSEIQIDAKKKKKTKNYYWTKEESTSSPRNSSRFLKNSQQHSFQKKEIMSSSNQKNDTKMILVELIYIPSWKKKMSAISRKGS
jgi:hypothetical protein